MPSEEPPEELQRKLPHDPKLWARNYLRHPNDPARPYDFYDGTKQKFLWYLVDEDGPMNPEQWGDINIFLFARGCLKTWTVSTIMGWGLDMYGTLEVAATAPVEDQLEEVIDRFEIKAEQSGLKERAEKTAMRHMKFRNKTVDRSTGEEHLAYSHLKARTAWDEGNKLRGIHAHIGVIDESQDVDEGTFSTFLEAIDRKVPQVDYFPTIFVIGTPKMANTFFHRLWKMSDQKTWDAEEKEWVQQAEPQEFLPEDMQETKEELEEKIEKLEEELEGAENPQRIERLNDLLDQFRDEHSDLTGFQVKGWHIDQHNSPLHSPRQVAFKRETYDKAKFKNEVEAEFYEPEHDLITTDDVWDAFVEGERFQPGQKYENTLTVLGADWGGGKGEGAAKTVVGVAELAPDEETLEILNVEILDPDMSSREEMDFIDNWMNEYQVDIAVVDEGHGDDLRQLLQDEYGYADKGNQRLYGCWYGNVKKKEEVTWNRYEDSKRYFTSSKSFVSKKMADDFKQGLFKIPKDDLSFDTKRAKGAQIVDQLTAPYTEDKETQSGRTKSVVISDRHDDVFDMFCYLWLAANKVNSRRTLKEIRSHDRPGR